MNRLIFIFILFVGLNNCSLNDNSRIWNDKEKKINSEKIIVKIDEKDKKIVSEFNQELKLDLSSIKSNNKIIDNQNNFGSQNYNGNLKKISSFKFSKLDNIEQLDFKPIFLKDGIIFFDKKGSIIRYNNNKKIVWKKNYYTKSEKKLKPKLNFILDNENLLVADNIAKYYSINISTGELNWIKNNDCFTR